MGCRYLWETLMSFMKTIIGSAAAAALSATAALADPAIIFDLGGKFDKSFNEAAFQGVLDVVEAPLVSSDFNHDAHSSVFHADQTLIMGGDMIRVLSWYDNEWAFSNRMADTAVAMGKLI